MPIKNIVKYIPKHILLLIALCIVTAGILTTIYPSVVIAACDKDADCRKKNGSNKGDRRFCKGGSCVACTKNGDCPSGQICKNRNCTRPTPTPAPTPPPYIPPPPPSGGGSGGTGGSGPIGYDFCSYEGSICTFAGGDGTQTATVAFGANGSFFYKNATYSIDCSTSAFGGDPRPGAAKKCYYKYTTSSSPNNCGGNDCRGEGTNTRPCCLKTGQWGCRNNRDCPSNYPICLNTGCTNTNPDVIGGTGGRSCIENRDCPDNNPYCLNGHCAECTGNARCNGNKVCNRNGNCVNPPPTPTPRPFIPTPTWTPTPIPTSPPPPPVYGSISGCVFIDTDGDGIRSADEENYTGAVDVRLNPSRGTRSSPSSGCYRFSNVPAGNYTLRLVTIPDEYYTTYPPVNSSYSVTLTDSFFCRVTPDNGPPACNAGNITQANFGLSNAEPWFQAVDIDIRNDNGITNPIPAASSCGDVTIRDGSSGTPGVLFVGSGSTDFGQGRASSRDWIVSDNGTADASSQLLTSHDALLTTLARNNVTPTSLSTICSVTNCSITNNIPDGAYRHSGNLTLNSAIINTKKVVIIVDGNLTINGNIQVLPGAYLMFVVQGDIIVTNSVGTASLACAGSGNPQLQGVFSTDSDFIIQGGASCPTADLQLQIAGNITTNAAKTTGGSLINNRSLCSNDTLYPTYTISPRLDFAFSTPEFILRPSTTWQEVAP